MKKASEISSISQQLQKVCDKINGLAIEIKDSWRCGRTLAEVYEDLLLDEVRHAQILCLELTNMVVSSDIRAQNLDVDRMKDGREELGEERS